MELTEKEKCQKGQLYDANNDPELVAERAACKEACFRYNQLPPSCMEERKLLLGELLGKTGKTFLIEQPFYCDYGYNISLGENFYSNVNCVILDGAPSDLWRQCLCGAQLRLLHSRSSARCLPTESRIGVCPPHHHRP